MEDIRVDTSMGSFTVELYPQQAPKACQNFTELSRRGYYDGVVFHRIIKDFMLQGGDPTGTGRGGESIFGGKFEVIAPPPHARTRTAACNFRAARPMGGAAKKRPKSEWPANQRCRRGMVAVRALKPPDNQPPR